MDVSRSMRVVADLDFSTDMSKSSKGCGDIFYIHISSKLSSISQKCTPVGNKLKTAH